MEKTAKLTDTQIITFNDGILGFEDIKQYELVFIEVGSPFICLQAVGRQYPAFVVCDPIDFVPDYKVHYSKELMTSLGAENSDDLRCLSIANITQAISDSTINLKSPIVLNIKNSMAVQFVTDVPSYSIKHKLFDKDRVVE